MKKRILLLTTVLFLSCSSLLIAQNEGTIRGQLKDANKTAIEGVVVSLFQQKDSALIKAVLTESDGKFEFTKLAISSYFLSASHLNFQPYLSESIVLNGENKEKILPTIALIPSEGTVLKEVVIAAKVPFVEKKIDRMVVNPEALLTNAGTTALDVLEKSPGIQVDLNGNISLKGKQGVLVYVDDKPTYLSEADLANYLRSLPSSSLASIEIMTNPPAKYDAAGNAGIINLRMKKTKTEGFNGGVNLSYGQGFYARSNNSANFNYRINKVNFFSNASYNINNSYQDLTINRRYFSATGELNSAFSQNTFIKKEFSNANLRLGMDYYINDKNTFGIVLSGFNNIEKEHTNNWAQLRNGGEVLQNWVQAISPSKRDFLNGSANLNYAYKLDTTGKELSANVDYLRYGSELNQSLLSNTYLPDYTFVNRSNLISDLPATIDIKSAKLDYVHPLKKGGRMEAGAKSSLVTTDNIANFFDETDGVLTVNNDFSNHFKYKENVNAAYVNYSLERKKFSFQTGLRYENTAIVGNQLGNDVRKDSSFTRNYNSLFPTVFLLYKLDSASKHQLSFSYGRRIDRPNYQDMNPFTYPLDRFTLYAGNPFLQPTFSDNFELAHTFNNAFTTTLSFSGLKNVINETIEQSTNIFYSRPGNIGRQISYGISVNGAIPITKWWTLQLYTEVMHNRFDAILYNQTLKNVGTYLYFMPTNQFQFAKTWSAELSGNYQSSIATGQFVLIPVWNMRGAVAKKIMKNKATVKLSFNDIFYTLQPGGDIKGLYQSTANWKSYLDTRVVTLSFSYRFNKGQTLAARNSGAVDTEKNRVK
ncbi:MAG: TonB-dependent receptor domain-containing protein [Bacteroidia bacterium]